MKRTEDYFRRHVFDRYVERGTCWEWTGARTSQGYGKVQIDGKICTVSRLAWSLLNGPIPEGMHVLHRCDNPPCIRQSHLWLGTIADNNRDMAQKGRAVQPIRRGEAHGMAKLTDDEVRRIRASIGTMSQYRLAKEYGVSQGLIRMIRDRLIWRHI